ncbi:MAG: hypothetical protein OEV34_08885 [Gammaproteobacteria bacterium]|jgi:hypothetical protein|nr:hypothetical protein [Gammaproteobacteria bacterium]
MKLRFIALLSALPFLAIGTTASAQADLTCADIEFSYEITSRYPDAQKGCLDVVEVDGERFAKMSVEVLRTGTNRATFRFKHADGSYGPTHRTELDPSWRANIGGRDYRIRDLQRGQELNLYLPGDRWEAHIDAPMAVFVTYYGYSLYEDDGGAGAALPSTASPLSTFGALGGAALFSAFLMRIYRRRSR